MNTTHLKKFAQSARKKLIEQVGARLEYVLTTDTAELRERADQISKLKEELNLTKRDLLIEKVAYTWFNRLVALRFMDVNDYQPLGIRVVSPKVGYTLPEILDEAKQGSIPEELEADRKKINALLDGKIPSADPQNEVYKLLLISSCNYLSKIFPFLFERINDYTELLVPDDLVSDFSIVNEVREGMLPEDSTQVEIIGWLYQFYISEKKDEVFASEGKVSKEDIPAATQLFTPRWIVEYMVQNTLGKLWLQNRPTSKLRVHMPYFIESASVTAVDYLKVSSPEEIKLLDQAVGSGHILVYAFELLSKIYEEEGYSQGDIPSIIIKNNLHGFEIDERAAQLAGMALLMKAREYDKRFFKRASVPEPNLLCFKDLRLQNNELQSFLNKIKLNVSNELWRDLVYMRQATNLGSLLIPHSSNSEIESSISKLDKLKIPLDAFEEFEKEELTRSLTQLLLLKQTYHCVVDNPPYMGGSKMNKELSEFVKTNYPESKTDLMACFIEAGLKVVKTKGYLGMINQHSWMFLGSYEGLRKKLIDNVFFDTLIHLGARTFPEIGGEVVQNASFTFWNSEYNNEGRYLRLVDYPSSELKRLKVIEAIKNSSCGWGYNFNQGDFGKISGSPIGYWLGKSIIELFEKSPSIKDMINARQGMATGNNERFIRYWFEVSHSNIGFGIDSIPMAFQSGKRFFPYNKGGDFRRWYGNHSYIIAFSKKDYEVLKSMGNHCPSEQFYFQPSVSWSRIGSGLTSFRFYPTGFLFDQSGHSIFRNNSEDVKYLMAFLNTVAYELLTKAINPTLNLEVGNIGSLPFPQKIDTIQNPIIDELIDISKRDWDTREGSWDFSQHELLRIKGQDLEETFDLYKQCWNNLFFKLHKDEEHLNHQFLDKYELKDEMNADVQLKDISILKEETTIQNDSKLVFNGEEIFSQFLSYSIGCLFGRYSLNKSGLILANQSDSLKDYLEIVGSDNILFLPDDDNIIPILSENWFEDDIVGRCHEFLKVTFGEKEFDKNLSYLEEQLGTDLRKYFLKNFYSDHIKRYKKRPIYWMFSSPKGHFNVLVYMHRYTPDTLNNILNKYLREFIEKLKTRKEYLKHVQVSGSATEQNRAIKESEKLDEMLMDCQEYERDILFPLASERINIDLDDGVLVNYNKFGMAVKEVAGLNDKKAKKQVREFDWIDTSQIR